MDQGAIEPVALAGSQLKDIFSGATRGNVVVRILKIVRSA